MTRYFVIDVDGFVGVKNMAIIINLSLSQLRIPRGASLVLAYGDCSSKPSVFLLYCIDKNARLSRGRLHGEVRHALILGECEFVNCKVRMLALLRDLLISRLARIITLKMSCAIMRHARE